MKTALLVWLAMRTHPLWCGFQAFAIPHVHRWRVRGRIFQWEQLR